jgi:hypothetical protein
MKRIQKSIPQLIRAISVGVLISFAFALGSAPTTLDASPARQIEEVRNFDARIINPGGRLAAQDCRTGQVIRFTDIQRFPNPPVAGRFYHFENALVWEGDPGVLYILEIESKNFRYWEIPGCPAVAPPQVNLSVDRTTITRGECATLRWDVENVQATVSAGFRMST